MIDNFIVLTLVFWRCNGPQFQISRVATWAQLLADVHRLMILLHSAAYMKVWMLVKSKNIPGPFVLIDGLLTLRWKQNTYQYWWHLFTLFSITRFNIKTALEFCSQTISQKWPSVYGSGPWANIYCRLARGTYNQENVSLDV